MHKNPGEEKVDKVTAQPSLAYTYQNEQNN